MLKIIGFILALLANGVDILALFQHFIGDSKSATLGVYFVAFISTPLIILSLVFLFGRVDPWVLFAVAFIPAMIALLGFTKLF